MHSIPTKSGNARWDKFVELSDIARETLRLSDAVGAGLAYKSWCLDADVPFEPCTLAQLRLWRYVIEWAGKLSRGFPGASTELCIARGRFVHSFHVAREGGSDASEAKSTQVSKGGQARQATAQAGAKAAD